MSIVSICRERGLYITPYLNTKMLLHYCSLRQIPNLEAYTALRSLFLNNNMIEKIEGLGHLKDLCFLHLSYNKISAIEGLDSLVQLRVLDLSSNFITKIQGLESLASLHTLTLSKNHLSSPESICDIRHNTGIETLDLSHNALVDGMRVIEILRELSGLKNLQLLGNPLVAELKPNYRKIVLASLSLLELTLFDDGIVQPVHRICAEAWFRGGEEEEKKALEQFWKDKSAKARRNRQALHSLLQPKRSRNLVSRNRSALQNVRAEEDFSGDECAVCQQPYTGGSIVTKISKCLHHFHQECISDWLSRSNSCPLCRSQLDDEKCEADMIYSDTLISANEGQQNRDSTERRWAFWWRENYLSRASSNDSEEIEAAGNETPEFHEIDEAEYVVQNELYESDSVLTCGAENLEQNNVNSYRNSGVAREGIKIAETKSEAGPDSKEDYNLVQVDDSEIVFVVRRSLFNFTRAADFLYRKYRVKLDVRERFASLSGV